MKVKTPSKLEKILAAGHLAVTSECGPPRGSDMEVILGILAFTVAVLAVLQGWQMRQARRARNNSSSNPGIGRQLDNISGQLGDISAQLGRVEQRLNDVWEKVNK